MSCTTAQLLDAIHSFYGGSDGRTRHPFNPKFIYTEGVKVCADLAGFHWLLDIVATEIAPICFEQWALGNGMTFLRVVSNHSKATLFHEYDSGGAVFWRRDISYTDFPEGEYTFFLAIDGLIEQPHDRLVMLLPTEN